MSLDRHPAPQSIYVYKAAFDKEVFSISEVLHDPTTGRQMPMDMIFSTEKMFKV